MQDWTAEVVARLHTARIKAKDLAKEMGVSNSYLSTVLNGKRNVRKPSIDKVFKALESLEQKNH